MSMALISWQDSYSVGVAQIDQQHQGIIDLLNRLFSQISDSVNLPLNDYISQLEAYAANHFSTEENYFHQFNFPDKALHIQEHEAYKVKVSDFKTKLSSGQTYTLAYDLMDFLENWWLGHIVNVDKRYSQYFRAHGLS